MPLEIDIRCSICKEVRKLDVVIYLPISETETERHAMCAKCGAPIRKFLTADEKKLKENPDTPYRSQGLRLQKSTPI